MQCAKNFGWPGRHLFFFFRLLDGFLVQEKDKVCVLHQPVLHTDKPGHNNKPDGYVTKLNNGVPSMPILVSDFKKSYDYQKAFSESLGYFQTIVTLSKRLEPMLVMPSTPTKLALYLCWPMHSRKHAMLKICEVDNKSAIIVAKFFGALKYAVELIDKIKNSNGLEIEPVRGIRLKECLEHLCVNNYDIIIYKLLDANYVVPDVKWSKGFLGRTTWLKSH